MKTVISPIKNSIRKNIGGAILCLLAAMPAVGQITDIASSPLVTSSSSAVYPNIFVMMDDSGSMEWDFIPDNGDSRPYTYFSHSGSTYTYGSASSQCNALYYNPAITYTPPYSPTLSGNIYPNSSFTNAWFDGLNPSAGTVNLSTLFQLGRNYSDTSTAPSTSADTYTQLVPYPSAGGPAFYFTYQGKQTSAASKNFLDSSSTFFTECNATAGSVAVAITISGNGSTKVNSVTVGSTTITSGATSSQTSTTSLAQALVNAINAGSAGYSATSPTGTSTVNIVGPASAAGQSVSVSTTGSMSFRTRPSSFPAASALFTPVVVSATSGLSPHVDERTNFANWYSYYRTRIQMMKSSLGTAFSSVNSNYRVGFATMNNNGGADFVNPAPFTGTTSGSQKVNWYNVVYGTQAGNGTPLLNALSNAGLLYANALPGSLNGVTANDPVQYACQQNYTLLSTDGYWNSNTNATVTGSPSTGAYAGGKVGEQDGSSASPRPFCDGAHTCNGDSNDTSNAGTSNTLADVAAYYYNTPFRSSTYGNCTGAMGSSVCGNFITGSTGDPATYIHMTLFTLGLGAPGRMIYDPSYLSETKNSTIHDYYDVANGSSVSSTVCTWGTSGHLCEWPTPNPAGTPENVDDLWHAAVNGHGTYFSASDPNTLAVALGTALNAVSQSTGAAAAATTSSPNVTSTSNFVYSSTYESGQWWGDIIEQKIDPTTGALIKGNVWSPGAGAQLDSATYTNRVVYYNSGTASAPILTNVNTTTLPSATLSAYFPGTSPALSQFCSAGATCLTSSQQSAASGQTMLNYILGDRSNEVGTTNSYYRARTHILGDIVDAKAAYVGPSYYTYGDSGYSAFVTTNSTRPGEVYVAANDGMLHAFTASSGAESWAFMPTAVIPNLYQLADTNYASQHQYYVDGTPVSADVQFSDGSWHTILVGGLNDGGRSYYALDVTKSPTVQAPTLLWEFTDTNLGYTYSTPVITKMNGTWTVMFSSGYNNINPGDGLGHLYALNAQTGAKISDVNTGIGSKTEPSGLGQIAAWVATPMVDQTALRVYAGDMLGNVWRFNVDSTTGKFDSPQLLVTLMDNASTPAPQPITAKPETGTVGNYNIVFVGTGRYLGVSDLTSTQTQSMYAIKDPLTTVSGAIYTTSPQASGSKFVQQTEADGTCPAGEATDICISGQAVRTSTSSNAVDFSTKNGWYINFPDSSSGERDNTDPILVLGTLIFNTNIPASTSSVCVAGGTSYQYAVDYSTGLPIAAAGTVVAVSLGKAIATNPAVVQLSNGTIVAITTLSNGTEVTTTPPIGTGSSTTRRTGWRETD